jgi:hypothetical protein
MSNQLAERPDFRVEPNLARRKLNVGVLAMLAGGVAFAGKAEAFARGADGRFHAASRLLAPWGVSIVGDELAGHDRLGVEIDALPQLEYEQVVGTRNRSGALVPFWKSTVLGNDAIATHFHPGEIVPCVRTTIEDNARATYELFDGTEGDIVPCVKVASEMLTGGALGAVEVTVEDDVEFRVVVAGGQAYRLVGGRLVPEGTAPA